MFKIFNSFKNYFIEEILGTAIGWLAGLLAVKLMSSYFETKSWSNIWGLWSNKIVVDDSTFTITEWFITIVFGFFIMKLVNYLLKPIFKIDKQEKDNTK